MMQTGAAMKRSPAAGMLPVCRRAGFSPSRVSASPPGQTESNIVPQTIGDKPAPLLADCVTILQVVEAKCTFFFTSFFKAGL